jgi:uncharacterized protein
MSLKRRERLHEMVAELRSQLKPNIEWPKTLYVSRQVLNAKKILRHFKKQGMRKLMKPEDLHVTICYSTAGVLWKQFEKRYTIVRIRHTKGRKIEQLGDEGAIVQRFKSEILKGHHKRFRDGGASWDYPSYKCHITLSYGKQKIPLDKFKPYMGKIELGPERFETIKTDKK